MSRQKLLTIFSGSLFSDNHEYQWTPGNGLTGTWASKTEKQDYLQGKKKKKVSYHFLSSYYMPGRMQSTIYTSMWLNLRKPKKQGSFPSLFR